MAHLSHPLEAIEAEFAPLEREAIALVKADGAICERDRRFLARIWALHDKTSYELARAKLIAHLERLEQPTHYTNRLAADVGLEIRAVASPPASPQIVPFPGTDEAATR